MEGGRKRQDGSVAWNSTTGKSFKWINNRFPEELSSECSSARYHGICVKKYIQSCRVDAVFIPNLIAY